MEFLAEIGLTPEVIIGIVTAVGVFAVGLLVQLVRRTENKIDDAIVEALKKGLNKETDEKK